MDSLMMLEKADQMLANATDLHDIAEIRDIATAARAYAKAAQLGIEATNKAAIIKIKAERKAGEYLAQLERGRGGDRYNTKDSEPESLVSEYKETIQSASIPPTTAHNWQKMATVPDDVFDEYIEETEEAQSEITSAAVLRMSKAPHVSHNSGNNEWYTPPEIIDAARRVMGNIDLDPASSEIANENVRALHIFTEETNGLDKEWAGNVWMNPPYASDLVGKFAEKIASSYESDEITSGIVLVNNATETAWFKRIIDVASHICFPSSRVKFWKPTGDTGQPLQGQAIIYIGENGGAFVREFSGIGFAVEVCRE